MSNATEQSAEGPCASGFVHLHLHSEYSLLDGGNRIDALVAWVKQLGMDAVAVTDHGNIHGAVEFYEKARAAGVKPILGVEAYVAPGDRRDRTYTGVADGGYHLVLLAENNEGWRNLLHLCSEAYLTGFYFKPRIDRALLREHNSGLIAINGHLGSEIGEHLLAYENTKDEGCWARAVESARWHADTFCDEGTGPRFFIELQHHVPEQIAINPHLIRLAQELDLPLVCDNDAHFMRAEDHDAHDTLICISMGKTKDDPSRLHYSPELYVKSPAQMRELFEKHYPDVGREACDNTVRIARRCEVELDLGANHAPMVRVRVPEDLPAHDEPTFGGDLSAWYRAFSSRFVLEPFHVDETVDVEQVRREGDRALRMLCEAGMVWRYGSDILNARHDFVEGEAACEEHRPEHERERDAFDKWARLNRELKILSDKLISAYFLIVWDFVNWGRQQGIPANARGSGVGTMVGYVLGLSNACPVRYGLLFERFTDPNRSEYPDIDIDLCQDGRQRVIDYVRSKYGHVAQIITFGTLKARAAVRDVCRVLGVALGEADRLAKMIPDALGTTLDSALRESRDLKKRYDEDETVRRVIDTARALEGQARHAGVHAAGVVIANTPLSEIVPLYRQAQSAEHEIVTQWDGPTCERMGLLKMDFLGLRTLSIIERCKALIRETLPPEAIRSAVGGACDGVDPLDLERLTYDDPRVFALFQRGDTTGVFQFESAGMRRLLADMKPDRLEDLIAANALFRPGPMDLIPDYNRRKHGTERVPSVHPIVDRFTRETYGVMVYQEQVMQIVHELGGIDLREAYSLIKAISKKKKDKIARARSEFIAGAAQRGLGEQKAGELFELIERFAGYGFNKSHSTGYAIIAYQTAYLKTYFPRQFMSAFMTYESRAQKVSDWIPYLDDCKRTPTIDPETGRVISRGIEVAPPSINRSEADFSVVFDEGEERNASHGHIRFGLRAIKGAGSKAIEAIIAERRAHGPFTSLHEFCERVPTGVVNKATIEALVRSGAFDEVHGREKRSAMVATIDRAVACAQKLAKDRQAGQSQLFGGTDGEDTASAPVPELEKVEPWSEAQTLEKEKETLGFYISSHPLQKWRAWIESFPTVDIRGARELPQDRRVIVAALPQALREITCRNGRSKGQQMGVLTIEDLTGSIEAVIFADAYAKYGALARGQSAIFVLGRVDHGRGSPQIIVDQLVPIDGVPLSRGRLSMTLSEHRLNGGADKALTDLRELLLATQKASEEEAPCVLPVELCIDADDTLVTLRPKAIKRIRFGPTIAERLRDMLGERSAVIVGGVAIDV